MRKNLILSICFVWCLAHHRLRKKKYLMVIKPAITGIR